MKRKVQYILEDIKDGIIDIALEAKYRFMDMELKKKIKVMGFSIALAVSGLAVSCGLKSTDNPNFNIVEITNNELPKNFEANLKDSKPLILKVSPTGCRYADIYKTIDFIKDIVSKYDINGPILYDIENEQLSNDVEYQRANALLAEEFCNKLTANGCYAGLYGSDEAMQEFEQILEKNGIHSIDLYDKLIIINQEEPYYDGVYSMTMDEKEKVKTDFDIVDVIEKNNLNEQEKFVDDYVYTVKKGDNLRNIASYFGMKTIDLALYNNLATDENESNIKTIYPGDQIKIPNTYTNIKKETNTNTEESQDNYDIYTVVAGDSISKIANTYNVSEQELIELNDLYDQNGNLKIIYPGNKLKIPNTTNNFANVDENKVLGEDTNKLDEEEYPSETDNRKLKGIDISYMQGKIDWSKVKEEQVDYAMLRICDFIYDNKDDENLNLDTNFSNPVTKQQQKAKDENGNYLYEGDIQFLENLKGCIENNIPFGIYYYSRALNAEDAKREAEVVINTLESTLSYCDENGVDRTLLFETIDLPIYMDIETPEQQKLCIEGKFDSCVDAAMSVFKERGYVGGIYCNIGQVTNITASERNNFIMGNDDLLSQDNLIAHAAKNGYKLWLVNNKTYGKQISISNFLEDDSQNKELFTLRDEVQMVQYTECGTCNGISENLDIDYANESLLDEVKQSGLNKVIKKTR